MERDYKYLQATRSLCDVCLSPVDAKIVSEGGSVYLVKRCPDHGVQRHMLEKSAKYYSKKRKYDKPGNVISPDTAVRRGCPFDCGLCEDHEQHTCIGLIEICDACNLSCPMCYASCVGEGGFLPYETVCRMIDYYVRSEGGRAEILQISGGEPTLHPKVLDIIAYAKSQNIGYVMFNTNGLRLARDEAFVRELAEFRGGFEVYLQFDSLSDEAYGRLRSGPLLEVKRRALENLSRYNVPVTLVCTVEEGVNDGELGDVLRFGLESPTVRGVNLQPVARFGGYEKAGRDSMTVSGVLQLIERQTAGLLLFDDFLPLPCNVDRVAITYLFRKGKKGGFVPITRNHELDKYVSGISNTFLFSVEDALSTGKSPSFVTCKCMDFFRDFARVVPKDFMLKSKDERIRYLSENTFRISVTSFVDRYNFDLKSMQKECVHIITPDLRRVPFSAYNMVHRGKGEGRDA